jgi:hypothetical protein
MDDADYHLGCDSVVRISPGDLTGPFSYLFEWADHPDYPQVKVGTCELAADHPGRCEMFIDARDRAGDTRLYWLTWLGAGRSNRLCTDYDWLNAPAACDIESPNGYRCARPYGHHGGHSFTASGIAP